MQRARNLIDVLLHERDPLRLRAALHYGWERLRELPDGRTRWKGTEEHKGQYRTQRIKPGTRTRANHENRAAVTAHLRKLLARPHDYTDADQADLVTRLRSLTRDQLAAVRREFSLRRKGRRKGEEVDNLAGHVQGKTARGLVAKTVADTQGGTPAKQVRTGSLADRKDKPTRGKPTTARRGTTPPGKGPPEEDAPMTPRDPIEEFKELQATLRAESRTKMPAFHADRDGAGELVTLSGPVRVRSFMRTPLAVKATGRGKYEAKVRPSRDRGYADELREGDVIEADGAPVIITKAQKAKRRVARDDERSELSSGYFQVVSARPLNATEQAAHSLILVGKRYREAWMQVADSAQGGYHNAEDAVRRLRNYHEARAAFDAAQAAYSATQE